MNLHTAVNHNKNLYIYLYIFVIIKTEPQLLCKKDEKIKRRK